MCVHGLTQSCLSLLILRAMVHVAAEAVPAVGEGEPSTPCLGGAEVGRTLSPPWEDSPLA